MKKILFYSLILTAQTVFAQITPPHIQDAKRCDNWGFGSGSFVNPPFNGRTGLNIPTQQLSRKDSYVDFYETNSHISDTLGNLLFYTNGIMIADSTHHVMMGCDTLNPGHWAAQWSNAGYAISQGTLILPFPNHSNLYCVFHTRIPNNTAYSLAEGIYYTIVDMAGNNGLGEVVSLRNPIIQNSVLSPRITACRHANGRDWWVVIRDLATDAYATMILSPQGVSTPIWHTTLLPQNNWTAASFYSQSCFSPDGTKFVYHTALGDWGNYITLYDFDRCNGIMNNPRFGMVNDSTNSAGVAFSPNSQYLYFNTAIRVFQVDVTNNSPFNHIDTVGVYDGFTNQNGVPIVFAAQQIGSDNRIYMRSFSNHYIHRINNPNSQGNTCSLSQHSIYLLTSNASSLPLSPYFPLGPLVGSTCDTLYVATTKAPTKSEPSVKVYPNPTTGILNIEIPPNIKGNAYLYNSLGQLIKQMSLSTNTQLKMYDIPNGIYFLSVYATNGRRIGAKRIVVQHE